MKHPDYYYLQTLVPYQLSAAPTINAGKKQTKKSSALPIMVSSIQPKPMDALLDTAE